MSGIAEIPEDLQNLSREDLLKIEEKTLREELFSPSFNGQGLSLDGSTLSTLNRNDLDDLDMMLSQYSTSERNSTPNHPQNPSTESHNNSPTQSDMSSSSLDSQSSNSDDFSSLGNDSNLKVLITKKNHNFRNESELKERKGDYLQGKIILPMSFKIAEWSKIEFFLVPAQRRAHFNYDVHPHTLYLSAERSNKTKRGKVSSAHQSPFWKITLHKDNTGWRIEGHDHPSSLIETAIKENVMILGKCSQSSKHAKDCLRLTVVKAGQKANGKGEVEKNLRTRFKEQYGLHEEEKLNNLVHDYASSFKADNLSMHVVRLKVVYQDSTLQTQESLSNYSNIILDTNSSFTKELVLQKLSQTNFCLNGSYEIAFRTEFKVTGDIKAVIFQKDNHRLHEEILEVEITSCIGIVKIPSNSRRPSGSFQLFLSRKSTECRSKSVEIVFREHNVNDINCLCKLNDTRGVDSSQSSRKRKAEPIVFPESPSRDQLVGGVLQNEIEWDGGFSQTMDKKIVIKFKDLTFGKSRKQACDNRFENGIRKRNTSPPVQENFDSGFKEDQKAIQETSHLVSNIIIAFGTLITLFIIFNVLTYIYP